jgi:hypothetical protein
MKCRSCSRTEPCPGREIGVLRYWVHTSARGLGGELWHGTGTLKEGAEHPVLDSAAAQTAMIRPPTRVELTRATVPVGVVPG